MILLMLILQDYYFYLSYLVSLSNDNSYPTIRPYIFFFFFLIYDSFKIIRLIHVQMKRLDYLSFESLYTQLDFRTIASWTTFWACTFPVENVTAKSPKFRLLNKLLYLCKRDKFPMYLDPFFGEGVVIAKLAWVKLN